MVNHSSVHLTDPPPPAPSSYAVYTRLTLLEAMAANQQAQIALLESQVSALQAQLDQRSARTRMRP